MRDSYLGLLVGEQNHRGSFDVSETGTNYVS